MKHLDEGLLQAWLDRPRSGLEPSEVAEIERHLAACDACARALEALRGESKEAHALLAGGVDRSVPRPPFEEVVRRARGHEEVRRARRRLSRLAWAASLVVALGVGWWSNDLYRQARTYEAENAVIVPPAASQEAPAAEEREAAEAQVGAQSTPAREDDDVAARPAPAEVAQRRERAEPTVVTNEVAGTGAAADAAPAAPPTQGLADAVAPAPESRASLARQAAPAGAAAPADQVVVTGVVRDERGDPVSSAQVFVPGLNLGVLTQQDGRYTLQVPARDSIDLTVERIGYRSETQELSGRDARIVADFSLQQEALQLQEVVVTGAAGGVQRRAVGNAVGRVDAASLAWSATTRAAAEAILERALVTLPDARVISVEVADRLVRVRQDLGDAVVLTLVQGRGGEGIESWPVESSGATATRRVDDLLVTATAPLTEDSLSTLLGAVR